MNRQSLKYKKIKEKRINKQTTCEYEVFGKDKSLRYFNDYLIGSEDVIAFEY
jgi:hypothetical protein